VQYLRPATVSLNDEVVKSPLAAMRLVQLAPSLPRRWTFHARHPHQLGQCRADHLPRPLHEHGVTASVGECRCAVDGDGESDGGMFRVG
jgi:hypothetical protein